jgi:tetrahydromethanopterin S-methyltransferase subunit C
VHTPVGARCRECANVRRLPQYNLGTSTYVRGASAALIAGAVAGVAWWFFNIFSYGWIFAVIFGLAIGYVVGEAVAFATNRRAGPPLQIIAAAGVVLAYGVRLGLLVAVDGLTLSDLRGFEIFPLLAMLVAAWFATQRVR